MSSKLSKSTIGVCLFILSAAFFVTPQAAYATVIAVPPPCTQAEETGGYLFDSFEEAEYVNGLLVIHLKHKIPYNDGRDWVSMMRLYDGTCDHKDTIQPPGMPLLNSRLAVGTIGYSVRFSSETHYDIWSDDTNTIQSCLACSVDIPATLPNGNPIGYVQFRAFVDGGASRHTTHLYAIKEPAPPVAECCSSVLFIPGIQASRLYRPIVFGEQKLWEPSLLSDTNQLAMNSDGVSINQNIYTKDILDQTYFGINVYQSFISEMDRLRREEKIADWKALPYDWRQDYEKSISEGILLANEERMFPVEELERLAAESQTGKVTIIAHSNGGLFGKALLRALEDAGKDNLVDRFVMVAVPQTGTPKAVASLLHGDGQGLPLENFSLLLGNAEARKLAHDMPGVYNLLPSNAYFDEVADPVVVFENGSAESEFRRIYGEEITTFNALQAFLSGADGRERPVIGDLDTPEVANQVLLTGSATMHTELDAWVPPAHIEVVQIVGWGLDTVKGVKYKSKFHTVCETSGSLASCAPRPYLSRELLFTQEGDETVVYPSAAHMSTSTLFFNINSFNSDERNIVTRRSNSLSHYNILESTQIVTLIGDVIFKKLETLPKYFSVSKPPPSGQEKILRIHIQSPVSIDLFDSRGNHTGLSTTTISGVEFPFLDENIPGSYYISAGEEKYIGFSAGDTYMLEFRGTGTGTATFVFEEVVADTVISSTTYENIPMTQSWNASMSIAGGMATSTLVVDADGDGAADITLSGGVVLSETQYLDLLETHIKKLTIPEKLKNVLLVELKVARSLIVKENKVAARALLHVLQKTIKKNTGKGIALTDAGVLIDLIEKVREKLDTV